jgi:membrane-associated phospholipid phosphatase
MMTMLFFYLSVYRYDNLFFPEMLDPAFAAMDRFLFGYEPAREWMFRFDAFWISEVLHAAYFFYYLALGIVPLYIFFARKEKLNETIFALVTVFYASSVTYMILPVAGGRFDPEVMAMTETLRNGPFTRLMAILYQQTTHFGAAFPSTHAALSAALAASAVRSKMPLRSLVVINGSLVMIAAVYGGYHYFVDIIAGLIYAGFFYPLGLHWHRRLSAGKLLAARHRTDD